MSDIYIEVHWDSGMEIYSYFAIQFPTCQSLPKLMSISDIIYSIRFAGEIENQTVTITLSNHDGYFSTKLTEDPYITEKKVIIKNSKQTLFTGLVREMPDFSDENVFILKVDLFTLIDREMNRKITLTQFPNCPEQNLGKYANYVAGKANTYSASFIAVRIDTGKYLATWNYISTFSGIYNGTTPISTYTISHDANDYTYIECSLEVDEIQFSCKTDYTNPAELLQNILEVTNSGIIINAENYTYALERFNTRKHTGNIFITGKTTFKELFSAFAISYSCFLQFNRELEVEITFTEFNTDTAVKIHPTFIKNFQKKIDYYYVRGIFTRKYRYIPATGIYKLTPTDVISLSPYNTITCDLEQRFLYADIVSWDIANREKFMREKPLLYVKLQIPKSFTDDLMPGNYLLIKYRKNFFPHEYRKILIMRICSNRKDVLDTVEGFDFSDFESPNAFIVRDSTDPDVQYIDAPGTPTNPIVTWVD